ncbi:MAG: Rpn family recombination-promoting nuclease/putative transposase [bacterium]|nr:Rpn family recombination-promoting nuclease/putative transposase [bacterium]
MDQKTTTNSMQEESRPTSDERFINPFTDYGFKRIFGTELSKDLLIEFLNSLLPEVHIQDLTFCNVEQFGQVENVRKAVFDVLCRNEEGEYFLVEMQRRPQKHFPDRILFYASFLIQNQMTNTQTYFRKMNRKKRRKGLSSADLLQWDPNWIYRMKHVYVVCFLDFELVKGYPEKYRWDVVRMDRDEHVQFGDALQEIYLEMPKFQLPLHRCETLAERFLYVLKNMEILNRMPEELNNQIFRKLKHIASMSRLSPDEMLAYQMSVMNDVALLDSIRTGREEGHEEGREEGRMEEKRSIARNLKSMGLSFQQISQASGLTLEEIEQL